MRNPAGAGSCVDMISRTFPIAFSVNCTMRFFSPDCERYPILLYTQPRIVQARLIDLMTETGVWSREIGRRRVWDGGLPDGCSSGRTIRTELGSVAAKASDHSNKGHKRV